MAEPPPIARPGIGAALGAARRGQRSMLRNHGGGHAAVSNLELFFDLVYVFAITQLSSNLHHHLTAIGVARTGLLFLAVWWAWIYTTWVTNWLDPDRLLVRLLLFALMLLSLAMATALPYAFATRLGAAVFAGCYLAQQIGRSLTTGWFFRGANPGSGRNMLRIACWFGFSTPFWLLGAAANPEQRLVWWALALAIEYAAPLVFFRVPGLGRSSTNDWNISGSHMAERCSLVVLIALGEGIVVTGSTYASTAPTAPGTAAFLIAFLGSALLWWLYFDIGAGRGAARIAGSDQAGRIARNAYTYLHMPIVAGIVISAVADALLFEHAGGRAPPALVLAQAAAMGLFVGGLGLFKRFSSPLGNAPLSHIVALALFAGWAIRGLIAPPTALALAGWGVAILLLTAVWEWGSFNGGWLEVAEARGWPAAGWARARLEARRAAREPTG